MRKMIALATFGLALLSACDKEGPAAPSSPDGAAAAPTASGDPGAIPSTVPSTWAEASTLDLDTQVAFMKTRVVPRLEPVFTAAGEEGLSCATCHGPDNQRPQDFLPHLTMADGAIAEFTSMPEVSKVMAEEVVPAMAEAMGEHPFDPSTGEGFGCAGCHTIDAD